MKLTELENYTFALYEIGAIEALIFYLKCFAMEKAEALIKKLERKKQERLNSMARVERAIDGLDDRERLVMRAHYIAGLTWEEIAENLYFSYGTVLRIRKIALEKLITGD